jgi:Fic family protein
MAELEHKAKYIYNSNRLDAVHVAFEKTLEILAAPPDPLSESVDLPAMDGSKSYDRAVVLSHMAALGFIEKVARVSPLTEAHIREIHRRLMEGVILSNGEYRECTLQYRGIPPVEPALIPQRIQRVVALLNQGFERAKDKTILAWQVHHEFIYVHPFIEGNGRMARLLLNLVRIRAGLDIEIVPFAEHERYLRSIIDYGRRLAEAQGKQAASASARLSTPS